jgi:hypothetical protein
MQNRMMSLRVLLIVITAFVINLSLVATTYALEVSDLSNAEASKGLKEALIQGASKAVQQLGTTDGFYGNSEVKIPLPEPLKKAEKAIRMLGMGKQADELVLKMNRAAEAAVPEAKILLIDSVKKMSLADAKGILSGPDDAATQYFKRTTSEALTNRFLPVVQKATQYVRLAQQYNKFAEMGSRYGLVKKDQVNLEQYVTQKTLDGVYLMIAKEEAAIRQDPIGQGTRLLRKVFGAASN